MLKKMILVGALLLAMAAEAYEFDLEKIYAPIVVGVPPTFARKDLCRTADGEIRHYGRQVINGKVERVYIASRDEGRTWVTKRAKANDGGAMVKSPWSGDWISFDANSGNYQVRLLRSKVGPGDDAVEVVGMPWNGLEMRQLVALRSRKRWVATFCDTRGSYHAVVAFSDDDGKTWKRVNIPAVKNVPRMGLGDKRPHWFCDGTEPTIVELKDGTILMCVRTSGPHAAFFRSVDGGETWGEGKVDEAFWQSNTMPYFFRLSDGRLLFIWNNTAILPTRDAGEYPELGEYQLSGQGEVAFTNRDALHAAISDDEGVTWKGFREIALNEVRNESDFRELGNAPDQEWDKSVHQTQALELEGGKVLVAYGQNVAARRMAIFDPDWLLETKREETFRYGLGGVSRHLYLKSLSGGTRGWAGHCAWNRLPGAVMMKDERGSVREVLQLTRVKDPRLVSDRQGVVWNFPAARKGKVTIECRVVGAGFRLTLADHWMNPCDEFGPAVSPISEEMSAAELPGKKWHTVTVEWDEDKGAAVLAVDGKRLREVKMKNLPRFGLSYLHLQTLAEETDAEGTYFRLFRKE